MHPARVVENVAIIALGFLIYRMGYDMTTWQFWVAGTLTITVGASAEIAGKTSHK